ncbi:MAG: aminotransferase class V-fold PLP-dependent enzyme [Desulfobacterales bacterium]|nr:aminotransferase class V-fold PLP-dependent enzyme [Desulfobacterales bacterium]
MPDKYESGTPNAIGLAGLGAGVSFILEQTIEAVRAKEEQLTFRFLHAIERRKRPSDNLRTK